MNSDLPVFVINLEKSVDRRNYMINMLRKRGLNGQIVEAIDGENIDLKKLTHDGTYDINFVKSKFSRELHLNEIGCALSHLKVYEKIVAENIPYALICEDDIDLVRGFRRKFFNIFSQLPNDWGLVYFWYRTKDVHKISSTVVSFPSQSHIPGGAVCYLLKISAAKKLLEEAYPIHYPADSLIGRSYRWGTKIYGSHPHLARLNLLFPSTIRASKFLINIARNFLRRLYMIIQ